MADLILIVVVLAYLARKFDTLAVLDLGRGLLRLEFHIPSKDDGSDKADNRKELK